ncbi:hypothetical protein QTA58_23155 [Neorhizobium sp. CSC1952]|uniref:hypothetical protein n=1 Tax=Neorhizobium sp. CSC1952 TaxID=2978974 RepID=UPI0025A66C1C|nr:hypothetical protein [Rhizobium sp. CSC1952]WJR67050.1 hypothetical protein QTA58_23155 [Rhizobium sp. CSC1952]
MFISEETYVRLEREWLEMRRGARASAASIAAPAFGRAKIECDMRKITGARTEPQDPPKPPQ